MARKVCILGTSPETRGGTGTVVASFLNDIKVEGYDFEYIMTHREGGALAKVLTGAHGYASFRRMLARGEVDIVHMHTAFGASFTRSILFIEAAKRANVAVVNHCHVGSWNAFHESASVAKRRQISRVYGMCDRLIALSDEWADKLSEVIPRDKIVVLENCAPSSAFEAHASPGSKVVLFLGRLETIKGCDYLADVCAELIRRVPDASFEICGEGSMGRALRDSLADRDVAESVKLRGWVRGQEKTQAFSRAGAFLLTSYSEGMPMCLLEAMAAGLPIVSSNVGGIPQIVRQGKNGFLCTPGDVPAFAEALERILASDTLFESMSAASRRVAVDHSPEAYSAKLKHVYDELLGSRGAANA